MRYGAPGYGHAKLEHRVLPGETEKHFFINSNGRDDEKFKKWQEFIGKKFESERLRFYYF
jgi:hypothetical protein